MKCVVHRFSYILVVADFHTNKVVDCRPTIQTILNPFRITRLSVIFPDFYLFIQLKSPIFYLGTKEYISIYLGIREWIPPIFWSPLICTLGVDTEILESCHSADMSFASTLQPYWHIGPHSAAKYWSLFCSHIDPHLAAILILTLQPYRSLFCSLIGPHSADILVLTLQTH